MHKHIGGVVEDNYDLINLTPDMAQVWGNMLKKLREFKKNSLYAVCSSADVEFTTDEIRLTVDFVDAMLLEKDKELLSGLVGENVIKVINREKKTRNTKTEKLKKLLGDDLVVVN